MVGAGRRGRAAGPASRRHPGPARARPLRGTGRQDPATGAAGADVVALDLSDTRLDRVRENLARTGLAAEIVVGDALEHDGRYDAILLDAPCTATGTIRRHPDLPFVKSGPGNRRAHAPADAPSGPRARAPEARRDRWSSAPAPSWRSKANTRSRPRSSGTRGCGRARRSRRAWRRSRLAQRRRRPAPLAQHVGRSRRYRRVLHGAADPLKGLIRPNDP
jgi:hypothetical protein